MWEELGALPHTPHLAATVLLISGLAAAQVPAPEGVLIGAGDIARCGRWLPGAEATARLVLQHPDATVFTLGDNAYPGGTRQQFRDCYGPTWGAFLGRTRPAVGNHEYQNSEGAVPHFEYFGEAAGEEHVGPGVVEHRGEAFGGQPVSRGT